MNKKERQALLKILLIREELNEKEFNNIINFIKSELLEESNLETIVKKEFSNKKKSRDSITSLISSLKSTQQEKYKLLSELYRFVQDATILKSVSDARNFGDYIGLKNTNNQSKAEVIYSIFEEFVTIDNESVIRLVSKIDTSTEKDDDSYKRLSDFIIKSRIEV